MKSIQRIFIFDRNEIMLFFLIGSAITSFTFTLGIHLGKRVGNRAWVETSQAKATVTHTPDQVAERQEFVDQGKAALQVLDATLQQAVQEEITKTGLKLETSRQVDLPHNTKSAHHGATTLQAHPRTSAPQHTSEKQHEHPAEASSEHSSENTIEHVQTHSKPIETHSDTHEKPSHGTQPAEHHQEHAPSPEHGHSH